MTLETYLGLGIAGLAFGALAIDYLVTKAKRV